MELAWKRKIYVPGQVFENKIAIDAALFSKNPKFWALWGNDARMTWKSGTHLEPELWNLIEETWNSDTFPRFRFNLFVQHKCPEYISSRLGNEYYYWRQPYFRYDLTDHQQGILYKLERKLSTNAIVVYACPSFWKFDALWKLINGKLVENSNFVKPHKLHRHRRYTFVRGGKDGHAFSEPSKIEGTDILAEIDRMFDKPVAFESNTQFVKALARDIKMTIGESDGRTREGFLTLERIIGYPDHELGSSIMTVLIFSLLADTVWGVGYQRAETREKRQINPRLQGLIDAL